MSWLRNAIALVFGLALLACGADETTPIVQSEAQDALRLAASELIQSLEASSADGSARTELRQITLDLSRISAAQGTQAIGEDGAADIRSAFDEELAAGRIELRSGEAEDVVNCAGASCTMDPGLAVVSVTEYRRLDNGDISVGIAVNRWSPGALTGNTSREYHHLVMRLRSGAWSVAQHEVLRT